jgi:hypothetical protein
MTDREGNTDAARVEEREVRTNRPSAYAPLEEKRGTSWVSVVGSNREAVTRALGRLRKAGAVEIRNRCIHVTDAATLERLAGAQR